MTALLRLFEGTPAIKCARTVRGAKASQQHYFRCREKCCENLCWWYAEVFEPDPRTQWVVPSMFPGCLASLMYAIPRPALVCACACEYAIATYACAARMWAHAKCSIPLCLGDFSVSDFQLAYINLDDENEGKLSKAMKVLRAKRRWALDELQLQTDYVLTIARVQQ